MRKVSVIAITATYLNMTFAITANITSAVETGGYFVHTVICTIIWASFPMSLVNDMKGEPMSDLISRQAAIDALHMHLMYRMGTDSNKKRLDEWINNLPSAQPERTCVNCGRTVNNGGWYADGRTRCPIEEHYALPKDGYCHLWEKRNVTDDDYPERRADE